MNEHDIFMIRQEIGELNRTIEKINRNGEKWAKQNIDLIDGFKLDLQDHTSALMDLANAIERAFRVVVEIRED